MGELDGNELLKNGDNQSSQSSDEIPEDIIKLSPQSQKDVVVVREELEQDVYPIPENLGKVLDDFIDDELS